MRIRVPLLTVLAVGLLTAGCREPNGNTGATADQTVSIERVGDRICIASNGVPDHVVGQFPNPGNPNRIQSQRIDVCVAAAPEKTAEAKKIRGTIGIAKNGVMIRPGTADWYDPSSRRGFSRDRSSGWNLEGVGASQELGLDQNNAHVDPRGLYHYHGTPTGLLATLPDTMMGWAADGFEIHVAPPGTTSSWQLKPGDRPTPPYGRHDGKYVQDWVYVQGSGTLDECNGGMLDGTFVYFATRTYPFYPRCLWAVPSRDFGRH